MLLLKRIGFTLIIPGIIFLLIVVVTNRIVTNAASGKTYDDIAKVPEYHVGVLLGTSKFYKNGGINLYFQYRMDAAERLYKTGKISYILVSGDNGTMSYNEPETIKRELIKRGIPKDAIVLDYAGFRTLDSMIRAKEIFGLKEFIIISQRFHNERAIYLAHKHAMNAVGFNAKDVEGSGGLRIKIREYFARTKAFLDILFNVEPKYYGEKIEIPRLTKHNP